MAHAILSPANVLARVSPGNIFQVKNISSDGHAVAWLSSEWLVVLESKTIIIWLLFIVYAIVITGVFSHIWNFVSPYIKISEYQ